MGMFTSFNINASGMTAQRYRMDIISENVANANTTRTADGTPYRRKVAYFEEKGGQTAFGAALNQATGNYSGKGVKVTGVYEDYTTEMKKVYDPSHPDADEDGYVEMPNVDILKETIDTHFFRKPKHLLGSKSFFIAAGAVETQIHQIRLGNFMGGRF